MTYSFLDRNTISDNVSEYSPLERSDDENWSGVLNWFNKAANKGQQAVTNVNAYIDKLINPLKFTGKDLTHIDISRPAGSTIKISTWTLSLELKYATFRPNARAQFPFNIEVVSDGVNIFKASMTPQPFRINTFSAANKPDTLKLNAVPRPNGFTKNGVQYKTFDVQGSWTVEGVQYGPKVYAVNFEVTIGVDGSVTAKLTGQTDKTFVNLIFPTKLNNEKLINVGRSPEIVKPFNPSDPRNKISVYYKTGQKEVSRDGYIKLAAWWGNLPKSTKKALLDGKASIFVKGYTDTVGRSSDNMGLSQQRAIKVHYYLSRFLGKIEFKAYIMKPEGMGEGPAREAGLSNNQSSSAWRKTEITIE